jgi:LacI family repressor for deo operon, udp, cdd, tsx, nupC, and nupG
MTVSRVVNGVPGVRGRTRERVLKAIKELGYYPNAAARALNSRRSHNIGIVFPRGEYLLIAPFCVELCVGVESHLKQRGYHLFLGSLANERDTVDLHALFKEGKVDGLILFAPPTEDRAIVRLAADRLPFVVVHGRSRKWSYPYVDTDNGKGTALVLGHLLDLGHRRIAFVTGSMAEVNSQDRLHGYRTELRSRGIRVDEGLVRQGDWTLESGYAALKSLLREKRPPTAIAFSNDQMAIGALKAAQDLGVRIPDDISITGYDDIQYASFTAPALTTVRQNIGAVGDRVAELMLERVEGKRPPRHIILDPELVIRSSSRALR